MTSPEVERPADIDPGLWDSLNAQEREQLVAAGEHGKGDDDEG